MNTDALLLMLMAGLNTDAEILMAVVNIDAPIPMAAMNTDAPILMAAVNTDALMPMPYCRCLHKCRCRWPV